MKKVLFVLALLLGALAPAARAQVVVDGVNINNIPEVQMIRMVAQGRVFSSKFRFRRTISVVG